MAKVSFDRSYTICMHSDDCFAGKALVAAQVQLAPEIIQKTFIGAELGSKDEEDRFGLLYLMLVIAANLCNRFEAVDSGLAEEIKKILGGVEM